jgi:tape measure domain-containing protein|tara:strand:- start:1776 stop:3896 length:2121 start_codon:yes stop_codon:yes gene_type:complete
MAYSSVIIDVVDKASNKLKKINASANKAAKDFAKLDKRAGGITKRFNALGKVLAAGALLEIGRRSIQTAADFQRLELRLKILTEQTGEFSKAQAIATRGQKLFGMSATEALEGVTNITSRLKPLGVSLEDIETTFIGFNTAAKLGGSTAIEASNAFRQLAQALGSGRLAGDEFRSVSEQVPLILKPLADELNVSTGALKQLAAEGKLTSEVVIRALRKLGSSGAEDLKKILENDPTQVFKNLQNEVEQLQIAVGSALLPAAKALTEVLTITAKVLNFLPPEFISIAAGITAVTAAATILMPILKAMSVTVGVLTKKFVILKVLLAGPVVAAIAAVGLAITGIIGHYKKQAEEQKKLTQILEEGTSKQVESLMEVKQKELEAAEARLENAKRGKSLIYQDIADLKLQIEQLDKRNESMKELNKIMEQNKTYKVGDFTYDTASGKAISGPGIKQEERTFEKGSDNEKAANSIKLLKQRIEIKSQENDIDRELLERQFEFQNKMEEVMGIEDEGLRLEKSKLILKDYQIDRQEILNQKVRDQVSISKELGDTLEQGLVENIKGAINGTQTFGQAMNNVLNSLKNKLMDRALSNLFSGIGDAVFGNDSGNKGFLGGILGSIFKANGGPVKQGSSYVVGERGPEIFTPRASGNITPNNALGGVTNMITVNVDASGSSVQGNEPQSQQLGQTIALVVQETLVKEKRNGGLLA